MNTIKYPAIILGAIISALSATLTFNFMYSTGQSIGLGLVFGVMGIALDMSKSFLPLAVSQAHKSGKAVTSIFLSLLCVCLMSVSFAASVFAVDSGASSAKTNSDSYKAKTEQIASLRIIARKQIEANQITKSASTQDKITAIISERDNLEAGSMLSDYVNIIAIVLAAAIELVAVAMCVIVSMCSCPVRTGDFNNGCNGTKDVIKPRPERVTVVHNETEEAKHITFVAKNNIEQQIKEAVVAQAVKPSVRGVRSVFTGLSNSRISLALSELGSAGILIKKGNGWAYA